jgi:hypothetical protein
LGESLYCSSKLKQEFIVVPLSCIFLKNYLINPVYETPFGYYRYTHLLGYDLKNEILLSLSVSGGAGIELLVKDAIKDCYFLKGKYCKWFGDRVLTCGSINEVSDKMYPYIYKAIMYLIEKRMIYIWLSNTSFFTFIRGLQSIIDHNNVVILQNFNSFIINPYISKNDIAAFVLGLVEIPRTIYADIVVKSSVCKIQFNEINCKVIEIPATIPKGIHVLNERPILALLRYNSFTNAIEIIGNIELDRYSASYYVFGKAFMISKIMYRFLGVPNVSINTSQLRRVYDMLVNIVNLTLFEKVSTSFLHFDEILRTLKNANIVIQSDNDVALADFDTYFDCFISKLNPRTKPEEINVNSIREHDTRACIIEAFVIKHSSCSNSSKTNCLNAVIL